MTIVTIALAGVATTGLFFVATSTRFSPAWRFAAAAVTILGIVAVAVWLPEQRNSTMTGYVLGLVATGVITYLSRRVHPGVRHDA